MMQSIEANLFAALDIAVMEYTSDCCFRMVGALPDWLIEFYPEAAANQNNLLPGEKFPFLDNFIIDAEEFWHSSQTQPLKSNMWTETDPSGNEYHFEASAFRLNNTKLLLISLVEDAYQEKQFLLQKCRESNLNYDKLVKESQKKEILIHCIVHDLAGQLTAIKCCFDLLSFQNLTPKGIEYLDMGKKQAIKQEMLIRDILNAFSAEVESLEAFTLDPEQAPDALACASEVVETLLPTFTASQMDLRLDPNINLELDWKVVGEKSRLDRVLTNLVENAYRHSPVNSTVTIDLQHEGDFTLISVNDEGPGVPPAMSKNLFKKFSQGRNKVGKAGLGLYFCRITVERWGGRIGYSPRAGGGSQFWFRLPQPGLETQTRS
ncbi:sensor histidine kinase [Aliterella atlantica]|uniref:histidine kinase n=1 Tax=Aliterella atlantica CENA595 TaxID=1618023 RepID=A0A0D8ZRA7_9CYAN|nr:HAMP domain-containing sensor histidine kinase [Aliterella atlantica]KJH69721.1 ATPase [Aliterella atlantica CENA595]